MIMRYLTIVLAVCVAICASATADWEPADGHKMHFPQLPNPVGWDVNATEPVVLADDWICTDSGWVTDIHFWGSWKHGIEGEILAFIIGIYSDIPADPPGIPYSRPGELLWESQVTDLMIALPDIPPGPEGWYDASTGLWIPEDHMDYFLYNVFLNEQEWFFQEEGTIYWLSVMAVVADPSTTQWGWKSTLDHFNDDAVWAFIGEYGWIDMWEPPDFFNSLDLAFVINGVYECEPTPDSSACNTVPCSDGGDECLPVCIRFDPGDGDNTFVDCQCIPPDTCHAVVPTGVWSACTVPDNGSGTANLPPVGCQYQSPDEKWMIIDGLPPGTTLEMDGIIEDFVSITTGSGGSLGGEYQQFEATLDLTVSGTGDLAGFNRHIAVPISCETHSAPRTPGDPVQLFMTEFFDLDGELFGDPDFCTFRINAGTSHGLPSPGRTILTELPSGDFAVESFFDITYEIEFEGCPGSQLADYMGTTQATIRVNMGALRPFCAGECPPGYLCEEVETLNPDGTVEICCECVEQVCEPNYDSSACRVGTCEMPSDECLPTCMIMDFASEDIIVSNCECIPPSDCHALEATGEYSSCVVPDNGTGTADLPPVGCQYQSPDEKWMIIDGLPPGTTIEMTGILMDFVNINTGSGGSLGGEFEQFDATLDLTVRGTGSLAGFNRHIAVPVFCETHSAPRTPGDPVQTFAVDFDSLQGELFGDPDFCMFRIKGGSSFGMPSPGQTRLIELPSGDFAVESFFDVEYEIEFEGCPASQLEDYMGTTRATIHIRTGLLAPVCEGDCPPGWECEPTETVYPDGTIEVCCECAPQICEPTDDGQSCKPHTCPIPEEDCLPLCIEVDPETGAYQVYDCVCIDSTDCHVEIPSGDWSSCIVPKNAGGSADLPPIGCQYQSPEERWMIIDGLPPGTTIEIDGILTDFTNISRGVGGTLGGTYEHFDATLEMTLVGTGDLAGFNRTIWMPLECETHSAPRLCNPVQPIERDFYYMSGEVFGDPDFCTFRIRAGASLGLPSPGHTILRELPDETFAVESFFDIFYQIEFEGCPGSPLADYMGTTTATIHIRTGVLPPQCVTLCPPSEVCEPIVTVNLDGTLDYCCNCEPDVCEPTYDGSACRPHECLNPGEVCAPTHMLVNLETGLVNVLNCACYDSTDCLMVPTVPITGATWPCDELCIVPDNGAITADLPPVGCEYESADDFWMITGGLPPGTTIEMAGILMDYINIDSGSGGSLGGDWQRFEATLDLTVRGTGSLAGFNRHLWVPVQCETHSAPRIPGNPIQAFEVDFDSLQGELFGDPDFCTFRIKGGSSFGMPSPGQTSLYQLPSGDFAVESFFDVEYEIEFEGCPASQLEDYMGTTRDTIRIRTSLVPLACRGDCPPGDTCQLSMTYLLDGTAEFWCECVSGDCDAVIGDANGSGGSSPIDIDDVVYLIAYIFSGGSAPTPYTVASGDANCSCAVDIDDVVYLIAYIFSGGPPPCSCEAWVALCGSLH